MLEGALTIIIVIPICIAVLFFGCWALRSSVKALFNWIAEKGKNVMRKIKLQHGGLDELLTERIKEFMQRKILEQIVNNHDGIEKICEKSKTNEVEYTARKQEYLLRCIGDGFSLNGTDESDIKLLNKVYIVHLKLDLVFNRLNLFFHEEYFEHNPKKNIQNKVQNAFTDKPKKHSMACASFFDENRTKLSEYRHDMSIEDKIETLRAIVQLKNKSKDPNFPIIETEFQRVTDSLQQMIGKEGEYMRQKFMQKYYHQYKTSKDHTKNTANAQSVFWAKVAKPKVGSEKNRLEKMRKYLMIYRSAFVQPNWHSDFKSITTQDGANIFPALITFFQTHTDVLSNGNFALLESKFLDKKQLIIDIHNLLDACIFKIGKNKKTNKEELMVRATVAQNLAEILPYLKYYLHLDSHLIKDITLKSFLTKLRHNFAEDSAEYQEIYLPLQEKLEQATNIQSADRQQNLLNRQESMATDLNPQLTTSPTTAYEKNRGLSAQIKNTVHEIKEGVEKFLHVEKDGDGSKNAKKLAKAEQNLEKERLKLETQQQVADIKEVAQKTKQERRELKKQEKFDEKTKIDSSHIEEHYLKLFVDINTAVDTRNLQIFKNLYASFFKQEGGTIIIREKPANHLLEAIKKDQIGMLFLDAEVQKMKKYHVTSLTNTLAWKKNLIEKRKQFFDTFLHILRQKFFDANGIVTDQAKYEQIYLPLFRAYCEYYEVEPATEMTLQKTHPVDHEGNEELLAAANCNYSDVNVEAGEGQELPDFHDPEAKLSMNCLMNIVDNKEKTANESIDPTQLPKIEDHKAEQV